MEGDHKRCFNVCPVFIFQSTPSAWRETNCGMSAHGMTAYFNPLPPHGGRLPGISRCLLVPRHFNPLPPHGGRRYACAGVSAGLYISIHSLRMEGDVSFASQISTWKYFNPLPPHGGRREREGAADTAAYFNPLPPHGGRPLIWLTEILQ